MDEPFSLRIRVRGYELDAQGHVNQAVYTQYAEHARWELLRAAGVSHDALAAGGVAPALLRATIRFQRELRLGDEVDVSCAIDWRDGRLFDLVQRLRLADGKPVAEYVGTAGLLDVDTRKLVADPRGRFRELASSPEVLGLPEHPKNGG
jgi:acyl-CoA thioester hydrolase